MILNKFTAMGFITLLFSNTVFADGKAIYSKSCAMCHDNAIAGAPKIGNKTAWAARLAQGTDTLYSHAIDGFQGGTGMMPPKGGNAGLSDDDVKSAVDHIVSLSK